MISFRCFGGSGGFGGFVSVFRVLVHALPVGLISQLVEHCTASQRSGFESHAGLLLLLSK